MKHIKKYNIFLLEGKLDNLSSKYENDLKDYEISFLKDISDNSSVNFEWLLKHYSIDKKNYYDNIAGLNILLDVLDDYFVRFLRIKKNLPPNYRDINNIKSTYELIEVIDKYNDYDKIKKDKNVDLLLYNEKWIVFIPKNYKSSKKWGWSRFCTSNDKLYFEYHNILHKSLVYVLHKFDYEKNIAIEVYPNEKYQIWNYQDDNSFGDLNKLIYELEEINDGFLLIDEVIEKLPHITMDDMIKHYTIYLIENYELDEINGFINSDFNNKNFELIYNQIKNNVNFNELIEDLRDSI